MNSKPLNGVSSASSSLLEGDVVIVVDVVEPYDCPGLLQQSAGEMKTDEACNAGDQNRHMRWSRLSEQIFRVDKWSACRG